MIVEGILLDVVVSGAEGCVLFDKAVNIVVVVDVIKLIDAEEVVITKGTGGRDSDDLAAAEDEVGKSCASVDADNLVTVGILKGIVGFKTADKGCSSFKGGHTIFVMLSSVWVVVVVVEDLVAWEYVCDICGSINFRASG
ncbi:hypothetical protein TNCV_2595451 [Trichonephila clavipes]|nr:hypothetical protein TNCV_2595451 [Trichonephila clavipes]